MEPPLHQSIPVWHAPCDVERAQQKRSEAMPMNQDRNIWLKRLWASKPTVGISLAAVLTSGTALASAGIFHYREFAHQLWHGQPPQVMAASMAAAAFALAAIAIRVNEIHSSQRKDS